MKFERLINSIKDTSQHFQTSAVKAININLTLRNWMVGYFIVEFEQRGEDRAEYGSKILTEISKKIKLKGLAETNLKICRQFYNSYPILLSIVLKINQQILPLSIRQSLTDEFEDIDNQLFVISQSATDEFKNTQKDVHDYDYIYKLLTVSSFTHFVELIKIEDEIKRKFYELLILKTTLSVRELQRQINSLTYERFGFSNNNDKALNELANKITPVQNTDIVKSHYFFEFLNIGHPQLIEESTLEQALIQHLQNFILELGNGFCFEGRQKRILIGDEYFLLIWFFTIVF